MENARIAWNDLLKSQSCKTHLGVTVTILKSISFQTGIKE
jgi:hypothetical protein